MRGKRVQRSPVAILEHQSCDVRGTGEGLPNGQCELNDLNDIDIRTVERTGGAV